jgi:hypothetical protein
VLGISIRIARCCGTARYVVGSLLSPIGTWLLLSVPTILQREVVSRDQPKPAMVVHISMSDSLGQVHNRGSVTGAGSACIISNVVLAVVYGRQEKDRRQERRESLFRIKEGIQDSLNVDSCQWLMCADGERMKSWGLRCVVVSCSYERPQVSSPAFCNAGGGQVPRSRS